MIDTFSLTFWKLQAALCQRPRYIDSAGGTRSGKTFSAMQWLIILAKADRTPTLTSVVSETFPHLRRGVMRDFLLIMQDEWEESRWSKSESIYTFPSGSRIEFFSADAPSKVHGAARDRLFINEAQHIPWEIARQLFIRTRGLKIADYNPTHAFWMHEQIQQREGCITINSTYLDARTREGEWLLPPEQVQEIEANKGDANWWRVYGEGKLGQLEGLIYDIELIDTLPQGGKEFYGLDFGFTNDPTALLHGVADTGRKILYFDELCYRTRMLNSDIVDLMRAERVPQRTVPIYADCAEPKSIAEIANAGFNIQPCRKVRSITEQVQWLKGWHICITKRSLNTIKEARNYTWAKDRDGRDLNIPIDKYNHAMDALRYGAFSHLAENAGFGQYSIGRVHTNLR